MLTNSPFNPFSPSSTFTFTNPPPRSSAPFLFGFLPPPPPPFPSPPSLLSSLSLSLSQHSQSQLLLSFLNHHRSSSLPSFLSSPKHTHRLLSALSSYPSSLSLLLRSSFSPSLPSFNLFISALSRLNRLAEAFSLFNSLSDFNLCPDAATYHSLMLVLSRKSQVATSLQLFDEMLNKVATPFRSLPPPPLLLPFPFSPFLQSPHLRPHAPQSPGRSLLPLQLSLQLQPLPRLPPTTP